MTLHFTPFDQSVLHQSLQRPPTFGGRPRATREDATNGS
jgi:hypothetical protein